MLKLKNLLTEGNKFDDVYKDYGFEVEKKSGGLTYWAHYGSDISGHKNSYIRGELSGWTDGKKAAVGDDRGRESFSNPKAMAKWFEKNFKMKKESIHENQKKDASKAYVKFEDVYARFLIASVDMAKTAAKITNNPVDKKIILKGLTKHVVPFMELIKSWHKGQQDNPHIDETSIREGLSSKWYKDAAKDFVGEYKRVIIQHINNEGYADVQQMVVDTVRSLQYDPTLRGKISADKLHDTVETLLHKQSWWKKLAGIREGTVYYDVYSNNKGSDANVYANRDLGKSPRDGFYAEVDNRYDMAFKNKAETEKWLKKNNYKHIGVDKEHY